MAKLLPVFLLAMAVSFFATGLVQDQKPAGSFNDRGESLNQTSPNRSSLEQIRRENYGSPNWWSSKGSTYFPLLRKNFCQTNRVPVGNNLSPPFIVCLNDGGFRDKDYQIQKPEDMFRIVALGDAVTFGLGVDNDETWPSYLEKILNRKHKTNFQVLNFGLPFKTTKEEVTWFKLVGVKYEPDLVIIQYMENDASNLTRVDVLEKKIMKRLPKSLPRQEREDLAHMKAIKRERRERQNMPIDEEMKTVERYLTELEKMSEKQGFEVFVVYYATEFSRRHVSYIRNASDVRGWGFTVSDLNRSSYTFNGSFYLTPEGSYRTAFQIYKSVLEQSFLEGYI